VIAIVTNSSKCSERVNSCATYSLTLTRWRRTYPERSGSNRSRLRPVERGDGDATARDQAAVADLDSEVAVVFDGREVRRDPSFEAAIHVGDVLVAHVLECVGGECGACA